MSGVPDHDDLRSHSGARGTSACAEGSVGDGCVPAVLLSSVRW